MVGRSLAVAIPMLITKENTLKHVFTWQHRCRQDSAKLQSSHDTGRTRRNFSRRWLNCTKVICLELPFQGHRAVFVPSGQRHSCTCVSERQGTSNYGSYYTSIQRNADKRARFETGNTLDSETGRHATATACSKTQTDGRTDRLTGNETKTYSRAEGQAGVGGGVCWGMQGWGDVSVCVCCQHLW